MPISPTKHPVPSVIRQLPLDVYRLSLLIAMVFYILLFAWLAFNQHLGMRTHKADLGQIDQAVWNSSRGRFLEMMDNGVVATRLTDHVEPILVMISPVLWLWDDVRALLLLQVILAAAGAWPLYTLALLRLDRLLTPLERTHIWQVEPLRQLTRPLALALALGYLLAPQLQSALLTEFHAAPLAVPFLLWAFWAVETKRWPQFVAAALLVAAVKEELALLAAGLGVWALWRFWILDFGFWIFRPAPLQLGNSQCGAATGQSLQPGDGKYLIQANQSKIENPKSKIILLSCHLVILLSLAWFYIATFVIVPSHAVTVYGVAESSYFQRYGALGDSPLDIFKSFFTQPGVVWTLATEPARLYYWANLLMPFGWLSLFAPEILLLALPVLLANLLSAYPAQYYGEFHYSAPLVPYFAVSAAYGLGRLWRWLGMLASTSSPNFQHLPSASAATMALAAFVRNARTTLRPLIALGLCLWLLGWAAMLYCLAGRGPLGGRYDPTLITAHHRLLAHFVQQIPQDAAVSATAAVHPHVSHRRYVYQFPLGLPELGKPGQADWALLDVTTNTDLAPGDVKSDVDKLLASDWGVVDAVDGFLLLQRGAANKVIPKAFYDFARLPLTDADQPSSTVEPLTLVEVNIEDWLRWRQTRIVTTWQVGQGFDPASMAAQFDLLTPDGEALYALSAATPPALIWYSPDQWQPGDRIKITTLPLYLPRIWALAVANRKVVNLKDTSQRRLVQSDDQRTVVAAYQRDRQGRIEPLWPGATPPLEATKVSVQLPMLAGDERVQAWGWIESGRTQPGAVVTVRLQWEGWLNGWPSDYAAFVHLRRNGETVDQRDGTPRWFLLYSLHDRQIWNQAAEDLRQFVVPGNARNGEIWSVVAGLYNTATGQRVMLTDGNGNAIGEEWVVGEFRIDKAVVPDQTCALIAPTCLSQPVK